MLLTPEIKKRLRATVFGKTAAGREEVATRAAGLNARQRSILILLDGRRQVSELDVWLPEDDVFGAIEALMQRGLVSIAEAAPPAEAPASSAPARTAAPPVPPAPPVPQVPQAQPAPPAPLPDAVLRTQALMADSARHYLGLMAAGLLQRIEAITTPAQLSAVMGLWHLALLESKRGKEAAEGLLSQAKLLLEARPIA